MTRALIAFIMLAACSNHSPPDHAAGASSPAAVVDAASAKVAVGKRVTVQGTARDAKLGPVVAVADLVVYCTGLPAWPEAVSGKSVTAHGVLDQTDEFAANQGGNGEVSAGTSGPAFVLRDCGYVQP